MSKLPRREHNKIEKRQRIRAAALELFSRLGYEETTMRDVASEAGVALGTLSLYAKDKRDLTLLVFNEKIGRVTDAAAAAAHQSPNAPLLDKLMAFFGTYYRDYAANYMLARTLLQLNYYSTGLHGGEYHALRSRVASELGKMVEVARATGEINSTEPTDLIARHFFFVFSAASRWWIAADDPKLTPALEELRRLLRIQINGLRHPMPDTPASPARSRVASRQ